ncbi:MULTISPECIES: hypothetical protein [Mammaliicoccus]|uniref:Type II toxin-antitoxin system PemK/MazF family toxin n=1 Tax=Mammaliicoccus sciuri TaxID=1296 RepID=A0ABT7I0M3_MAMSC|nr:MULTISPECIES: hypothetical protein [Mammaliicoccus]MCJ0914290.1 hypothetical protein [Mammaliicoccus sciuri]MDL0111740.1 hypothetical protein [Mammaliicoccus sciuri]MDL0117956.1 hypothetical protein [Mammaliicoccus sciuri]WQJ66855.1 hypothetical protein P3T97_05580 [Mammaliicoccus sciuri]
MDLVNTPRDLINKIVYASFPYFDLKTNKKGYKLRPVLIIGAEKDCFECDLTMLPISTVSNKVNLHSIYDVNIGLLECPSLHSSYKEICYVRTHKQSTVYSKDIVTSKKFDDLSITYQEKLEEIKFKVSEFNKTLF